MKTRLSIVVPFLMLACTAPLAAQTDSLGSFDEGESDFKVVLGVAGGLSLVNPGTLNDEIGFLNNSLDAGVEKIQTMTQFAAFMRIKPRMAPYMLVRVEAVTVSRSFDYSAVGRSAGNSSTGRFNVSSSTRWTVYPLVLGVGTTIPKTPLDAEVGLIYAIGETTETGSIAGGSEYTNTSSGSAFGLEGRISPHFRLSRNVNLALELSYRSLTVKHYSDSYGRDLTNFGLDLTGVAAGIGVSYTFD